MIFDHLNHGNDHSRRRNVETAFRFLQQLQPDCELGEYPLQGESVFARVMEYHTLQQVDAVCEAHRRFVDIQVVLAGSEYTDVFYAPELETKTPYNEETDVELFVRPKQPMVRVHLQPGYFVMFAPSDAHSPQIMTGSSAELVKKAVVKIDVGIPAGRHPEET